MLSVESFSYPLSCSSLQESCHAVGTQCLTHTGIFGCAQRPLVFTALTQCLHPLRQLQGEAREVLDSEDGDAQEPRASSPPFSTHGSPLAPLWPWLCESSAKASEWLRYQKDQWGIEKRVLLGEIHQDQLMGKGTERPSTFETR